MIEENLPAEKENPSMPGPPKSNALGWICGLICFIPMIRSLSTNFEGFIPAAIIMLIGFILVPPFNSIVFEKTGIYPRPGVKIASIIGLLFFAGIFIQANEKENIKANTPQSNPVSESKPAQKNDSIEQNPEEKPAATFSFTVESYIEMLNKDLERYDTDKNFVFKISKDEKADNNRYLLTGSINEHLGFVIDTDGQRRVKSVLFLGNGDGTMQSGANLMMAVLALVRAANQVTTPDKALGKLGMDLMTLKKEEASYKGVHYKASKNDGMGYMLVISPEESRGDAGKS